MRDKPDPNSRPVGLVILDVEELAAAFHASDLALAYWKKEVERIEAAKFEGWRSKAALAKAQIAAARSLQLKLSVHRMFHLPDNDWFSVPIEKRRDMLVDSSPSPATRAELADAELERYFVKLNGLVTGQARAKRNGKSKASKIEAKQRPRDLLRSRSDKR